MGMDGVDIVMKVEDAFDIAIEDGEAEKMITPRDIIEHVMRKVGRRDKAQCLTQRAFHRVRASLMQNAGLKRAAIKPDASTRTLFPVGRRKVLLRKTIEGIGINAFPEMVRPNWLVTMLSAVSLTVGVAAGLWSARISGSSNALLNFLAASPAITGSLTVICCGWLGALLTRVARYDFKPSLADVGGLSRWVVAHGAATLGAPPGQWSREQVAERVRETCIDVLDCEKIYREDARFVEDLGLN